MKIRITDKSFAPELEQFLISQFGAEPTSDPLVFEVSEDLNPEAIHGIEVFRPQAQAELAACGAWLSKYTGNFDFYLSVKAQFERSGSLSPKQIAAVLRAIDRDRAPSPQPAAHEFSLKPKQVLIVGKWLAKEIAEKGGHVRPHHAFEVVEVEAETPRAYKVALKFSAQRTSFCGVCGLALTDPKSVEAGIGPICASRLGVSFSEQSLEELREILKQTIIVSTWIPKRSIKEII